MIAGSIQRQSGTHRSNIHLCLFTFLFGLALVLSAWQHCESQSVPYRIDSHFYKKSVPPAPTFGIPQELTGQQVILPSGERATVYRPSGQIPDTYPTALLKGRSRYAPSGQIPKRYPRSLLRGSSRYSPSAQIPTSYPSSLIKPRRKN